MASDIAGRSRGVGPRRMMSPVRSTLTRMARSGLDPDTALDVLLSAICSRNRYTADAAPVVDELRRVAGDRLDIMARVAGSWVGYYGDDHTRTLCKALLEIPGATDWVGQGRARRDAGAHSAPFVRPVRGRASESGSSSS